MERQGAWMPTRCSSWILKLIHMSVLKQVGCIFRHSLGLPVGQGWHHRRGDIHSVFKSRGLPLVGLLLLSAVHSSRRGIGPFLQLLHFGVIMSLADPVNMLTAALRLDCPHDDERSVSKHIQDGGPGDPAAVTKTTSENKGGTLSVTCDFDCAGFKTCVQTKAVRYIQYCTVIKRFQTNQVLV